MRRLPLLLLTGGVSGALLAPVFAVPRVTRDDGLRLLRLAAGAARRLSFHGTQMVTAWSPGRTATALVDVTHSPGEGSVLRVQPDASQPGRTYVDREETGNAAGISDEVLGRIAANYDTVLAGTGSVAGRVTDVVVVRQRSGAEAGRYWLDRALHLVLRREIRDARGRAVRESAFLDIAFTPVSLPRMAHAEEMPGTAGRALAPAAVAELTRDGWQVPRPSRQLTLLDARVGGDGKDRVLQLTFSDGMSSVSLFQQRGRLDRDSVRTWTRTRVGGARVWIDEGFPTRVVWSSRGTVFTVVAECPDAVLTGFLQQLPHGERRRSVAARFGRGLVRVGSWFNPFG